MAKSQQQLGGDASKKCKVLEQLRSQLDMLLQKCKEVVEEETNSSSLEDEHIRRMSDFIIAFRKWNAPPLSGEFRKCLAGTEGYDRSTQSQILENSIDIVDKMDELLRNVDELTEKLKMKQGQFGYKNCHLTARLSRSMYDF
ncbi:hypothetical protein COOONC_07899 [Cooperia oncophora]